MKKLNVYDVYKDDTESIYKVTVPAENATSAKKYAPGNGEVVAVKEKDFGGIDTEKLAHDLFLNGWGREEIDVVCRVVEQSSLSLGALKPASPDYISVGYKEV